MKTVPRTKPELSQVDFASFSIDPSMFVRVFENLVENAIKNNGSPTPTLQTARDENDREGDR